VRLSKRQVIQRYGFNAKLVEAFLECGILELCSGCTPLRPKIESASLAGLVEGEHYIVCLECGAYQAQITTKHLRACSGIILAVYQERHPNAPQMSAMAAENKVKTEEQKRAQSEKLKARFQTPAGEETRRQIAEASQRLHASGYREKAAAHLKAVRDDPAWREQHRQTMRERWASGELRAAVEGWHRDNREASLASAAHARRHITTRTSKLHLQFKGALTAGGLDDFQTEYEVGYYSIDEAQPELKLAVEVDGCYWHGCAECGFPGVAGTQRVDRSKTTYLTKRGWTVLRVKGHEVRADLDACVRRVRETVASLRGLA